MANYGTLSTIRRRAAMFLVIFNFLVSTGLPRIFGTLLSAVNYAKQDASYRSREKKVSRYQMPWNCLYLKYIISNFLKTNKIL